MNAAWVAAVAAAIGVLIAIGWKPVRWAWRTLVRLTEFLDDYFGHPARPGVEARPGVMVRLQSIEKIATEVRHETQLNGGNSLRDTVQRTASDVAGVKADVADLRQRIELFESDRAHRAGGATGS